MKHMLIMPLIFVLLLNATGIVKAGGQVYAANLYADTNSKIHIGGGNIQTLHARATNGSSIIIGSNVESLSLFAGISSLLSVIMVGLSIDLGSSDSNKKTSTKEQPGQIRRDISLYKQFMQWAVSPNMVNNDHFSNLEYRRELFSFDPRLLPDTETSADRMAKEIIRLKYSCAAEHLKLFGYEKSLDTYSKDTYNAAKNYKTWYETATWPKIFWFWYKKPNLDVFYKLQMQYRYVKYKQLMDRLGLQLS